jgi:RNA polymerase sigma-70 factor (ECF subfamily)
MWHTRRRPDPEPVGGSDADLLAAIRDERIDALRLLHERHAPWLKARLSRRCADPDAVDTAIQDTFVAVWRGAAARYRARDHDAGGWLWTIAIRKLISVLRSRGTRWIGDRHGYGLGHGLELAGRGATATATSAEDVVLLGVEHGDIGAALARLSPELRAVIQATVLDGLTVREASQLLGIPTGTVKTRAMRAKAQLREHLA